MINRRFLIKKKLGQGRSAVYLCEDLEQAGKNIALKILPVNSPDEEKKAFKDEYQILQMLDHPNIIRAYERGAILEISANETVQIGSKYLAMEYFDGKELLDYIIKNESSLKEIITQISSVLFYLHQSNYIYYDLKLENILINEINGKPVLKLIDLGFARPHTNQADNVITGTAEYLAPEILKKEPHDHRIDLYSFGILLYRLIFGKFPFNSKNHLEIYKEQIGKEFDFPETKYSLELINVVKKLLNKNPEERYFTSIQILYDLNIPISEQLYRDWVPIKVFSDRTDILNIVNRYVSTPSSGEIIIIRGFERAGKTAVSQQIYSRYENVVQLPNDRTKTGFGLIKFFLNKLIFHELIFDKLSSETLALVGKIINNQSQNLTNDLKLVVNGITSSNRFILLLDDFNMYDSFSLEIFKEIFPVFQVNGWNVILTEKSDLDYATGFINNSVPLDLTSFTTAQIEELLEKTYADFFPINEVRQLIMKHADFLPGNVIEFLRDLVLLKIIRFDYDGIKVVSDESSENVLINLYEEIYNIRYKSLNDDELKISSALSSFENTPDNQILIHLTGLNENNFTRIIEDLQRKHILQSQSQTGLNFSSDGLKNFLYSQIPNKKKHHEYIAETIKNNFPQFSKVELARQYQICENYDQSYLLLMGEVEEAEKISAFKYEQNILEQLLKLPLNNKQIFEVKFKLCLLYHLLNIYKNAFSFTEDLLKENVNEDEKKELLIIKGNSLIKLGEVDKGKETLRKLLPSIKEETKKLKVMLDIAWCEFETNNYEVAANIVNSVISNSLAQSEYKGDSYNLLGSIDYYQKDDLHSALLNFEKSLKEYSDANLAHRIAAIEINIGNICNILGDYEKVETHWNKSLEISSSTGNYYQHGMVLLNFGGFHFHNLYFERAIENYRKAGVIFNSLGDQYDRGLTESNLGEVYLFISEYQNAIDALKNAVEIFHKIRNTLEQSEALFLLAKVYLKIGDHFQFDKTIQELNYLTSILAGSERIKLHVNFLDYMKQSEIGQEINPNHLNQIANEYFRLEERINYFEAMSILINYFIFIGESSKAFELLTDKNFTEICSSNIYLEIEKLYLMGKIASMNPTLYPKDSIFYFDKAYNLMSDLNVNETTCKLIFELSNFYYERGNVIKAKEYASYGRSLINLMADQFKNDRLKDIYLNTSYRKNAWEKFTEIINYS